MDNSGNETTNPVDRCGTKKMDQIMLEMLQNMMNYTRIAECAQKGSYYKDVIFR